LFQASQQWSTSSSFRRQENDGDVGRDSKPHRHMPAGLIGEERGVCASRNGRGNLDEMQVQ
jgi:hypothetical protein